MDVGVVIAIGTVAGSLITGSSAWGAHRLARSQHERDRAVEDERRRPELDELVARTTASITEAANDAVASMQSALRQAELQLNELRRELAAAREDLRRALEARDDMHTELAAARQTIAELRTYVDELEHRVEDLEARVGGRRDSDTPGPALR